MRPDPTTHGHDTDGGRIIYLGDVRRRRAGRGKQAPDHHYLLAIGLVAIAGWSVWLAVVLTLPPAHLLTYLAFFLPMFVGLAATGTVIAYGIEWKRGFFPRLSVCLRRGGLAAATVITNLACVAAHRWMLPIGVISLIVAVLTDVGATARGY